MKIISTGGRKEPVSSSAEPSPQLRYIDQNIIRQKKSERQYGQSGRVQNARYRGMSRFIFSCLLCKK